MPSPRYDHTPHRVPILRAFRRYLNALGRAELLQAGQHRRELLDLGLVVVWQPGLTPAAREASAQAVALAEKR